jgi:hypothetical protein
VQEDFFIKMIQKIHCVMVFQRIPKTR